MADDSDDDSSSPSQPPLSSLPQQYVDTFADAADVEEGVQAIEEDVIPRLREQESQEQHRGLTYNRMPRLTSYFDQTDARRREISGHATAMRDRQREIQVIRSDPDPQEPPEVEPQSPEDEDVAEIHDAALKMMTEYLTKHPEAALSLQNSHVIQEGVATRLQNRIQHLKDDIKLAKEQIQDANAKLAESKADLRHNEEAHETELRSNEDKYKKELKSARDQLAELDARIGRRNTAINTLKTIRENLTKDVNRVTDARIAVETSLEGLRKEKQNADEENESLKVKLQQTEENLKAARAETVKANEAQELVEGKQKQLIGENTKLEDENESVQKQLTQEKTDHQHTREQREAANRATTRERERHEATRKLLRTEQDQRTADGVKADAVRKQLEEVESSLELEKEKRKADASEHSTAQQGLQELLKSEQEARKVSDTIAAEKQQALNEEKQARQKVDEDLAAALTETDTLRKGRQEVDKKLATAEGQLFNLRETLKQAENKASKAEQARKDVEVQLSTTQENLESAVKAREDVDEKLSARMEELTAAQKALTESNTIAANTEQARQKLNEQLSTAQKSLENERKGRAVVNNELDSIKDQYRVEQKVRADIDGQFESAQQRMLQLWRRIKFERVAHRWLIRYRQNKLRQANDKIQIGQTDLTNANDALRKEKELHQKTAKDLTGVRSEVSDLQLWLNEAKESLQGEQTAHTGTKNDLQQARADLTSANNRLDAEIINRRNADTKVRSLEEDLVTFRQDAETAKVQAKDILDAETAAHRETNDKLVAATSKADRLDAELQTEKTLHIECQKVRDDFKVELDNKNSEITELTQKVAGKETEVEQKVAELEEQKIAHETHVSVCTQDITSRNTTIADLNNKISAVEGQNRTLTEEKNTLIEEKNVLIQEKGTLVGEKNVLTTQNQSLVSHVSLLQAALSWIYPAYAEDGQDYETIWAGLNQNIGIQMHESPGPNRLENVYGLGTFQQNHGSMLDVVQTLSSSPGDVVFDHLDVIETIAEMMCRTTEPSHRQLAVSGLILCIQQHRNASELSLFKSLLVLKCVLILSRWINIAASLDLTWLTQDILDESPLVSALNTLVLAAASGNSLPTLTEILRQQNTSNCMIWDGMTYITQYEQELVLLRGADTTYVRSHQFEFNSRSGPAGPLLTVSFVDCPGIGTFWTREVDDIEMMQLIGLSDVFTYHVHRLGEEAEAETNRRFFQ